MTGGKHTQVLEDALLVALPYVEGALDDPAFKKGAVRRDVAKIRAALARVEAGQMAERSYEHCRECGTVLPDPEAHDLCGPCADRAIDRYNEAREWREYHCPDPLKPEGRTND